jgi:hypothetical protein
MNEEEARAIFARLHWYDQNCRVFQDKKGIWICATYWYIASITEDGDMVDNTLRVGGTYAE